MFPHTVHVQAKQASTEVNSDAHNRMNDIFKCVNDQSKTKAVDIKILKLSLGISITRQKSQIDTRYIIYCQLNIHIHKYTFSGTHVRKYTRFVFKCIKNEHSTQLHSTFTHHFFSACVNERRTEQLLQANFQSAHFYFLS